MIESNLNTQILGRWINDEIEYVFSQNNTFQITTPNSEKLINGYYTIEEKEINFTYIDYSHVWKGSIEYIDLNKLQIKHSSNKIVKNYNLKKTVDNYSLKKKYLSSKTDLLLLSILKEKYYPILLMNDELKDSLFFDYFEKPNKPEFTEKEPKKNNGFLFYILFVIIGVLIFIYLKSFIGLLFIFVGIYLIFTNPEKKKYLKEKNDFENYKKSYESQLKKYYDEITLNEEDFLKLKNKEKISSILRKFKYSIGTDYIKGLSHQFFLNHLIHHFGSKHNDSKGILESLTYLNNYFTYKPTFRPYVSDFAYVNDEIGLVLLIEIDEPYTIQNKEPIHLNDNDRNSFFLELNWIIIRFSEEQILTNTNECCDFVSQIILKFEEPCDETHFPHSLLSIERWNNFNIYRLINSNYRENYLKMNQNKL
jgi:very-short-patch-repair endonuclease